MLPKAAPPPRRNPVAVTILVGAVVLALVGAGIAAVQALDSGSAPGSPSSGPTIVDPRPTAPLPSTAPSLARFYGQVLRWAPCGRDQCTRLAVPLDYAHPTQATIHLAVLRVPAQIPSERLGALVVNPGGPGGSGIGYAGEGSVTFGEPLSDRYDIVGFDPRGVGSSDPLSCLGTPGLDRVLSYDPDPDTPAEGATMARLIRGFGDACLRNSGDLVRHVSTIEVARDMDILRAALGEPRLNYLGASYGTYIGATYANLFPTHVGRFVLDGAIDPSLTNEQLSLEQAGGFEVALRSYVANCVAQTSCVLGSTVAGGIARIQGLLSTTDAQPLPTGDAARPLTEGLAMLGIWRSLYSQPYWGQLTSALHEALLDHRGSELLTLADDYTGRGPTGYTDNSIDALYAVNCLDHGDSLTVAEVPSHLAAFEKVSPTFGRAFAWSLVTCGVWPVRSDNPGGPLHAAGAPPIVVVGTTRDPATPLRWAQALAAELDSGRLITRNGDGHTGFRRGNSCVDDAVQGFLLNGVVPPRNLHC
jgi:pimeloyl-ACP methyl ester carboxylesterase